MTKTLHLLFILLFSFITFSLHAQDIEIRTAQDLTNVRMNLRGSYKLMNNIDLADLIGTPDSPAENYPKGWNPIAYFGSHFSGSFDGNGFTIKGLWINYDGNDIGLFGHVKTDGTIQNLAIEVVNVPGGFGITGEDYVGALAGRVGKGTIKNCSATGGAIRGNDSYAGGLLGSQKGTLINCFATVNVEGGSWVGGLIGMQEGSVSECFAAGMVTGTEQFTYIGGLVGESTFEASLINSYATGNVTATGVDGFIGGLVGRQNSNITNCYAIGKVEAAAPQGNGGLVGMQSAGSITASYYDTETTEAPKGVGNGSQDGVTGLTTADMKDRMSYDASWKINIENSTWRIDPKFNDGYPYLSNNAPVTEIYTQADLANIQNIGTGDAAEGRPFKLMNDITLDTQNNQPGIATDKGWVPIGDRAEPFTGSFYGNGFAIKEVWIDQAESSCVGFLGYVDTNGTIRDLRVEVKNVPDGFGITGKIYVGALAGEVNKGKIQNCSATGGAVTGEDNYVGGLIGLQSGTLTNSYATVAVEGKGYVGGLIGRQKGEVKNSFAIGTVTGADTGLNIGGLVGELTSTGSLTNSYATGTVKATKTKASIGSLVGCQIANITNCYATGKVEATNPTGAGGLVGVRFSGTLTASYYDTETTGKKQGIGSVEDETSGAKGLTTEQMVSAGSYSWTIGTPGTGSATNPWEKDSRTYPYLYWQTAHIITVPAPPAPPVQPTPPAPPVPPAPVIHKVSLSLQTDNEALANCVSLYPAAGEYEVEDGSRMTVLVFLGDECDLSNVQMTVNGETIASEESKLSSRAIAHTFRFPVTGATDVKVIGVKRNNPTSSPSNLPQGEAKVWASEGTIHISSPVGGGQEGALRIYTISGKLVVSEPLTSHLSPLTYKVPSGLYIVVVGDTVVKACVN